ncbi:hypothetical protein F5X97DRAFT_326723 [Nemania serpens]|nr:hypothetical protein F5X97DRAFT_326723 [Nemania serpens]
MPLPGCVCLAAHASHSRGTGARPEQIVALLARPRAVWSDTKSKAEAEAFARTLERAVINVHDAAADGLAASQLYSSVSYENARRGSPSKALA